MKLAFAAWLTLASLAVGAPAEAVVIYNKNLPASKELAEYYAGKRGVPTNQLFGVDVSASSEAMSRPEFNDKLQRPIFDWLVAQKLFTPNPEKHDPAATNSNYAPLLGAKVRYMVLSYGIPLKVVRDTNLKEENADKLPDVLRRNEAAVDAELALIAGTRIGFRLAGPLQNPFYAATNAASLHPTNGLMMVARLDGPSVEIARGLVDKAMQAETNGLWGHAYFDARGLTNGDYKLGDDWLRASAAITKRLGFETTLDQKEATWTAAFPVSQVAFYAGWYDAAVSGPFTRENVEFMPGAFAYHLHSYNAASVRSAKDHWVGPLLAKGAAITLGSVDEPYLTITPNISVLLDALIFRRLTFGEAAYMAQPGLSWQTTVIGDPLYQPFGLPPDVLHLRLERRNSPLVEWSHLRVNNLNQATGLPAKEIMDYLHRLPVTTNSAVLMEKMGDLQRSDGKLSAAAESYASAVNLKPSPMQKLRLLLALGEIHSLIARDAEAFAAYQQLLAEFPDYPERGSMAAKALKLARRLGKSAEVEKFEREIQDAVPAAK